MTMALKILRYISYSRHTNYTNILLKSTQPNVLQKSQRNLHVTNLTQRKMFMETENQYAYSLMEKKGYALISLSNPKLSNYCEVDKEHFDKIMNENWSKQSPSLLFEAFLKLAIFSYDNNLNISNKIFDSFIDSLTDNIGLATDEELKLLFHYLLKWPETESIRTRNYIEVWAALDDECLNRLNRWSFDQMLGFVSMFYMLNVTKYSDYCLKCIQKLAYKAKHLTPNQLVETLFFVGIMRKSPNDMHALEIHLDKLFESFSIDELAIMSMGFFKSKTPIRSNDLVSKIGDKVIEQSKDVHEVSLAALLKIIRYSNKALDGQVYKILDVLQHEIPRLSVMCRVHLALLGTATLSLHKECLHKIAMSTLSEIDKTRLKDLERLILTFGTLNFAPETETCLFQKVVEELRKPERLPEIEKHGRSFACCVSYLAYLKIYPLDLMNKVLSPEFLERTYGKHHITYGREVLAIHNSAKIFCSEKNMNYLSDKCATSLAKKYTDYVPNEEYKKQYNVSERMFLDVMKTLKDNRGGNEYVVGGHIVTHHQRGDVIVCNNHDYQPMEVKKQFSSVPFGNLHKPPDGNNWVALVVAGRNTMIQETGTPTGPFETKVRELGALGFHAELVLWSKYTLLETKEAKTKYLNSLIKSAIHNGKKYEIKLI
ncbi:uncharacterized protein LOC135073251 [Ostrinia nubilalis]|uniref:uncharacterized protein LOC135073251 n=1 Tax=Ostrinia nubilalis TaxID=29057 RepID=UPI003082489B